MTTKKLEDFPKGSTAEKGPKTPYKYNKSGRGQCPRNYREGKVAEAPAQIKKILYLEETSPLQMDSHPAMRELLSLAGENRCALKYAKLPIPKSTNDFF